MPDGNQLGRFLRSRRARALRPAGPAEGGRRRVAGLRRDECAHLAGISVEYYTRLEQGRATRPSPAVVTSLGRALQLDAFEQEHLARLANPPVGARSTPAGRAVRPDLQALIDSMDSVAAVVFNRGLDVVAHNHLAAQLFVGLIDAPPATRNGARFVFLEPFSRKFLADWPKAAGLVTGQLHLAAQRWPDDARLARLVGELSIKSTEFRTRFAGSDVVRRTHGTKSYHHPVVGDLELNYQILDLPGDAGYSLETLSAPPATPAHDALAILGSWGTPT